MVACGCRREQCGPRRPFAFASESCAPIVRYGRRERAMELSQELAARQTQAAHGLQRDIAVGPHRETPRHSC